MTFQSEFIYLHPSPTPTTAPYILLYIPPYPIVYTPSLTNPPPNPDHPLIPVHLLIFGIQAFVTSLTCLIDVWSWPDRTTPEKQQITYLYGPYVALGESSQKKTQNRLRQAIRVRDRAGLSSGCDLQFAIMSICSLRVSLVTSFLHI